MKKLLKIILCIILVIIILITLFLIIINNKKFTVYTNDEYGEIFTFSDKIEIYPEFKKFNKSDLPVGYEYDGYITFHLKKIQLELAHTSRGESYMDSKGEHKKYFIKNFWNFSLKALKYSKENNDNMDFLDKIMAMLNKNQEIHYYQNGQTGYIENYGVNNSYGDKVLHGEQISYYEDGQISANLNYINGQLDGKQSEYYSDGKIFVEGTFEKGNGIKVYYSNEGEVIGTGKYINGKIDSGLEISVRGNDFINLVVGSYNPDGYEFFISTYYENYENGKLNGVYNEYYTCDDYLGIYACKHNGSLVASGYYKDGLAEGEFIKYYRDGNIFEKCFYEEGIGDCVSYYPDGNILREGKKQNGVETAGWPFYDKEFGDRNYYDENGDIIEIYEHDVRFVGNSKYIKA